MASAVVDRAWRDTAPEEVEHDLASLWREMSGRGPVARAVMSNLVVFRMHERRATRRGDEHVDLPDVGLEAVVARHPSRVIVIEHDRGDHDVCAPIGAGVGVIVFGSAASRYAIEQIVVRSACAEVSLPSIVRRFLRGDVPTSVWWMEDLSRVPPLDSLVTMGRQLIYDSRRWRDVRGGFRAIAALVDEERLDLADINWRRLRPLRRAIAEAFASAPRPVAAADVQIDHRPGDSALAWLLAGWLASGLRWPRGAWPTVREARHGGEILSVVVRGSAAPMTAMLNPHRARVEQPGAAPLSVAAPRDHDADAVAAELRALSFETALRDALRALCAIS